MPFNTGKAIWKHTVSANVTYWTGKIFVDEKLTAEVGNLPPTGHLACLVLLRFELGSAVGRRCAVKTSQRRRGGGYTRRKRTGCNCASAARSKVLFLGDDLSISSPWKEKAKLEFSGVGHSYTELHIQLVTIQYLYSLVLTVTIRIKKTFGTVSNDHGLH